MWRSLRFVPRCQHQRFVLRNVKIPFVVTEIHSDIIRGECQKILKSKRELKIGEALRSRHFAFVHSTDDSLLHCILEVGETRFLEELGMVVIWNLALHLKML